VATGGGQLRADAARNRAGITRAAKALIIAKGPGVEVDEIARKAGVAVGTLYRHFPAKDDLIATVLAELGEQLEALHADAVARVRAGLNTGFDEIALLLRRAVVDVTEDRLLLDTTQDGNHCLPPEVHRKAVSAVRELVAAAQEAGQLHPDVTADDVTLLLATSPGGEVPQEARERWVALALRSLSAAPA
jgi:AcrR family transcriptional regulator